MLLGAPSSLSFSSVLAKHASSDLDKLRWFVIRKRAPTERPDQVVVPDDYVQVGLFTVMLLPAQQMGTVNNAV